MHNIFWIFLSHCPEIMQTPQKEEDGYCTILLFNQVQSDQNEIVPLSCKMRGEASPPRNDPNTLVGSLTVR